MAFFDNLKGYDVAPPSPPVEPYVGKALCKGIGLESVKDKDGVDENAKMEIIKVFCEFNDSKGILRSVELALWRPDFSDDEKTVRSLQRVSYVLKQVMGENYFNAVVDKMNKTEGMNYQKAWELFKESVTKFTFKPFNVIIKITGYVTANNGKSGISFPTIPHYFLRETDPNANKIAFSASDSQNNMKYYKWMEEANSRKGEPYTAGNTSSNSSIPNLSLPSLPEVEGSFTEPDKSTEAPF